MEYGSLFSGIGGFDLGLDRAGMSCTWQAENDEACNRVLVHHWPDIRRFGNVKKVTKRNGGTPRLVCGGFPCQDLSVAGKRAGLAGKRSGLWSEFRRVLTALTPRWVLIENVPGLLSSKGGKDMGALLWQLGQLGYGWAYRVLDAQHFHLAQRRQRVFIVGCLGDTARAGKVLFEPESCDRHSAPSREAGKGVAATIRSRSASAGVNAPGRGGEDDQNLVTAPCLTRVIGQGIHDLDQMPVCLDSYNQTTSKEMNTISDPWHLRNLVAHTLRAEGADASEDATGRGTPLVIQDVRMQEKKQNGSGVSEGVAYTLDGTGGQAVCFNPHRTLQKDGTVAEGFKPDTITDALHGPTGNKEPLVRVAEKEGAGLMMVRRLTPRECERLQGFPDEWTIPAGSDSARYRCLGNAVAVPVAEWIARRIVCHD